MEFEFDIIVIGGGHAGCEAAAAAANMGCRTLLVTINTTKFAQMSCNPAIGGVAKGQIVREIDAMGGYTGIVTDRSTIQFRMLNRSKGPAMRSLRAQREKPAPSPAALAPDARADTQPQPMAGQRNGPFDGRSACDRGKDPHGRRIQVKSRHFDRGNLSGGSDARRAFASRGRPGRRFRVARPERATRGARLRNRSHENRHAGTHRRTQRRFQPTRRAERRRKPGKFSYSNDTEPVKNQLPCYLAYTSEAVHDLLRTGFADSPSLTQRSRGSRPALLPEYRRQAPHVRRQGVAPTVSGARRNRIRTNII